MRKDWRTKGIIMTRVAGTDADTTPADALDLADMLEDPATKGAALVLLAGRATCAVSCAPVGRRPGSIRDRGYGPID
jgi:hypothetical protein